MFEQECLKTEIKKSHDCIIQKEKYSFLIFPVWVSALLSALFGQKYIKKHSIF